MFIREAGPEGSPVALLLHGQGVGGELFDGLSGRLAMRRRVLVPDLPGHGRSPPLTPYRLAEVHRQLAAAVRQRTDGPVDVVGFSIGAYHALALALAAPAQVSSLALVGPLAGLDEGGRRQFGAFREVVLGGADLAPLFLPVAFPAAWAGAHPGAVSRFSAAVSRTSRPVLADELLELSALPDLRPRLREIRCPTMVRSGLEDLATPHALAREITALIPGARLEAVEGAGHQLLVQDEAATITSVERFLGEVRV